MNPELAAAIGPLERWRMLVGSFPSLPRPPDLTPFALDKWASRSSSATAQSEQAARFCLSVYNMTACWKSGPFNAVTAMCVWDAAHRAAFIAWCEDPFWI